MTPEQRSVKYAVHHGRELELELERERELEQEREQNDGRAPTARL
jgi:hypothetical protein